MSAIVSFDDLGAPVRDIALAPNPSEPWRSRILALLDSEIGVLDLDAETVSRQAIVDAVSLTVGPDFQLRGVSAPLIVTVGATGVNAYLLITDTDELVSAPLLTPAEPAALTGACLVEASPTGLTFAARAADGASQVWRVRDAGDDALALERLDAALSQTSQDCVDAAGRQLVRTNRLDVPSSETGDTDVAIDLKSDLVVSASPGDGVVRIGRGAGQAVNIRVETAFNAQGKPAPERVAASSASFGGSFGGGVLVVSQDESVSVLALDDVALALQDPSAAG